MGQIFYGIQPQTPHGKRARGILHTTMPRGRFFTRKAERGEKALFPITARSKRADVIKLEGERESHIPIYAGNVA